MFEFCPRGPDLCQQSIAPIPRPEQSNVRNVGCGQLHQVATVARQVMTHDNRHVEERQIQPCAQFIGRCTQCRLRGRKIPIIDIGLPVIDNRTAPAQFCSEPHDGFCIETSPKDQNSRCWLDNENQFAGRFTLNGNSKFRCSVSAQHIGDLRERRVVRLCQ